ncbi:mmar_2318 family lipooligosaccharide biosynthesis protein [Mycobacterium marinum]|uniref:Glycosyl hydrolases family 43 n=1 Tax=Mycobacterium marinum (strain ATCC BAA-535 / M) TaxID=216594 RepID=B2HQ24_MYCMM|nr:hypothetical protein [Mycobacterium marinum]ACC40767.1 conserved hypothetical protein [Mycobacterium marinum M]AXN44255.1 hypothetical protein MM1218R_02317 [Mycobacterium marinum]AXN49625.1 hypothetical protein CCUG20998_02218 [Mycobacterium marinum]EPQ76093.1 hypothetical protein MMMB2_0753 [Mycobacterium marinum MB2]EPQ79938.1 hypothetical protein MMEU_0462 [Mycobacterium marinum str. Europe]
MPWRKLGRIFVPSGELDWARTHASQPVAEWVDGDIFRIYFSTRDDQNRSSIGSVVVDLAAGGKVLEISPEPVLGPGALGMFDDCGVSMGSIVPVGDTRFLYYMGWNLAVTVPWKNAIGLAISQAGGPFKRWSTFPVVPLDEGDPYSISYPWVIRDDDKYRMWYGSNVRWEQKTKNMDGLPHVIKSAESIDAIHWEKQELVAIDTAGCDDIAAARPCVVRDPGLYRMWYCARGAQYSIYHAVSEDGVIWTQLGKDNGIDASPGEWDANSVGYPCVFDHKGQRFLIYSGDGYGRTGFGLAVLDD